MDIDKLKNCVEQHTSDNNMFVIGIKCSESNVIDITIDSMTGITLDKCIQLSKFIDSQFDREEEDYELTVSGASISEPFKHIQQYYKNSGKEVEVQLLNSEKLIGIMGDVNDSSFSLTYSKKILEDGKKRKIEKEFCDIITYDNVKKVTLVIKF